MSIPRDERLVTDREFFEALDLNRRALSSVRQSLDRDDLEAARKALVEYFRTRTHPKWFFDIRSRRRGRVFSAWSGLDVGSLRRADLLLRNRFVLRDGKEHLASDFGKDLRWKTAEMRQNASTAYALKRCNFLRDLAVAYTRGGDSRYSHKFSEFADRWLSDWPLVIRGFHPRTATLDEVDQHDTMTTAFRWFSWVDSLYGGIPFAPEVSVDTAFGLLKSIWFSALQYRHYATSPYVPANHHLFERGTAPFMFGIMLPEFPEVAKLVDQAKPVIARHVKDSFLSDGGYEERTTTYTVAALHMFLMPVRLAALNRVPLLDRKAKTRLKRCGEMMALLTLPNGEAPDVGDGRGSVETSGRIAGATASLFKSRTAASVIQRMQLGRFVDPFDRHALKTIRPRQLRLTVHYPKSGYFVARDSWTRRASAMFLSVPGPGIYNHAHDDALSLQIVVRGESIVGTPMSELYSYLNRNQREKKKRSRGHFYAMTSHNVVLVGGEPARSIESLIPSWGPEPTPVKTEWMTTNGGIRIKASHRAYAGVRLSREVNFQHRKGWTVRDQVRGKPTRNIARWHFEYGVEVTEEDVGFVAAFGKARLSVHAASPGKLKTRLYRDLKWLAKNPLRPSEPAPWVLDVTFSEELETEFKILKTSS